MSVAKDAADMMILGDDFEATMRAVMWGRNIYNNVRRFLQFQVTVNFTVLIFVFIGSATYGKSPLNTVQLLWLNLIMDTLAALALSTERPAADIIKIPPIKKGDTIMTPVMWRQIYGMTIYMVFILTINWFFTEFMWDLPFDMAEDNYKSPNGKLMEGTNKTKVLTIIFCTFIFMQIFNEINARKVGAREFNVFIGFFRNFYFIAVIAITVFLQFVFVEYLWFFFTAYSLTQKQYAASILWGASTIIVSMVLKVLPEEWMKKLPVFIDENKAADPNDVILSAYNKQANAKVTKRGDDDGVKP